ncbi:MAG: ATP-binding protein [Halobacteriota archaeon]
MDDSRPEGPCPPTRREPHRNSVEHSSAGSQATPADSVEYSSTGSRTGSDDGTERTGTDVTIRVGILDDATGFYFEDDGSGFPDSVHAQVDTQSWTARGERGGYGLQIVQKIAGEHGWEMRLTDGASGGARIEFHGVAPCQRECIH